MTTHRCIQPATSVLPEIHRFSEVGKWRWIREVANTHRGERRTMDQRWTYTDLEVEEVVLAYLRRNGCNCEPHIFINKLAPNVGGVDVAHDGWCALYRRMAKQ